MTLVQDRYQSRVETTPAIVPRQEPAVYGEGPSPAELTASQVTFFEENGYLFFEDLFAEAEVAALRQELQRLAVDSAIRQLEETIAEPDSDVVRSIFRVHQLSPMYAQLCQDARILKAVQYLLGGEVYIHQSRVNFKPGFSGKEFYWHSDFETWHTEDGMPQMRAVSVAIALTDNTEFNGPLMVIPGSHKQFVACVGETPENHYQQSLRKQEYGVPDEGSLTKLVAAGGLVAPKGKAGSAVLFDCNMMHGSNSNISPFPRSNVFFVYNSVHNQLQPPYGGTQPRPEFIAARDRCDPLVLQHPNYMALAKVGQ
jgi:ectoine hydroxylase